MPRIPRNYWPFYLDGYDDRLIPTKGIDIDAIALKAIESDQALADVVHGACVEHAIALQAPAKRLKWTSQHKEAIAEAGGDEAAAYAAWVHGKVDVLAFSIMPDVLAALTLEIDPDDEDEEDEDEEDDEEDDEDEEDD